MMTNKMRLSTLFFLLAAVMLIAACSDYINSGTKYNDGDQLISEEMNEEISNYIIQKYSTVYIDTEKRFEVHKVYGTEQTNDSITVYMYSYFGGFNKSTGLKNQAGHSLPAVIRLQKKSDGYSVTRYMEPKDGSLYQSSLKKMFPKKYLEIAQRDTGNINDLHQEMDSKVKQWLDAEK